MFRGGTQAGPCPVTFTAQTPELLDYLSAYSGVFGTVLALAAFLYSLRQARKSELAGLNQRRTQFELNLLAEISRQLALTRTFPHVAGHLLALRASSHVADELTVLRAATQVDATPAGQAELTGLRNAAQASAPEAHQARQAAETAVLDRVVQELSTAIQSRLQLK